MHAGTAVGVRSAKKIKMRLFRILFSSEIFRRVSFSSGSTSIDFECNLHNDSRRMRNLEFASLRRTNSGSKEALSSRHKSDLDIINKLELMQAAEN